MKIIKRILAITSFFALIVCVILGIKKGLFNELINQLKTKNQVESEFVEAPSINVAEMQTTTNSTTGANSARLVTFNESYFHDIGEDIFYNDHIPSYDLLPGEVMVNVKSSYISAEADDATLEYLENTDELIQFKNKYNDTYLISVEVQFTNVGTTKTSWMMGSCSIVTFDKNGQANTHKQSKLVTKAGIISGTGNFDDYLSVLYLEPGETALCKTTCLVDKDDIDNAKNINEQIYFIPSSGALRSWTPSYGPERIGFVELKFEDN